MNYRLLAVPAALIAACAGALAGCSADTEVSLTGNSPAQYSHVWVTTQEVWFNASAVAGPDDGGWSKYSLSTPTTIDLVAANSSNLSSITSSLRIVPGTYSQVRLIPVDASAALSSSAQAAGALYNSEADYVDSSGTTHQLPLELLNPDKGIGIGTSLKVPIGNIGAALAGSTTGTTGTTATTTGGTTTGTSGGLGIGSTSGIGSSAETQSPNQFAVMVDGTTDLLPFNYAPSAPGIMLSQHASAYDLSKSGGISGQLTLTNITTGTSGLPAIQVSAQILSTDGSRHEVVSTSAVQADGSFLLYPLTADTNGAYYDVVIHGPAIATIIIKSVEVTLPSSSSLGLGTSSTSSTTNTTSTTTTGSTTTTTGTAPTANNVVAIGTLTPRTATSYTANFASPATLPAGSQINFYQTLQGANSVPYVIESSPIDPFNGNLFNAQALATQTIDSGTWSASGAAVTVVSAAPAEGAGNYHVAAAAPSYGESAISAVVKAPASTSSTSSSSATTTAATPQSFTVPALSLASGTASGTISASVSQATAARYDSGELLVSSNGTLVGRATLGADFASGSASVTLTGLPAETPSAIYYVSIRAWSSSDPVGTLVRQWYDTPVDLRGGASGSIALTVD